MTTLFGHTYSESMIKKYKDKRAWPCSVETCKKLHTSKHFQCREHREKLCTHCEKVKTTNKICAYCEGLVKK
jgi:hypothetical protein